MTAETTAVRTELRPETLLELKRLTDVEVAPDGSRVAFSVGAMYTRPGEARRSSIWVADVAAGEVSQVTFGPGVDEQPRFSPDGARLAFVSDRGHAGLVSVHVLGGAGAGLGEARPVGEIAGSAEQVLWAPDGRTLLVLAADPGSDRAGAQSATRIEDAAAGDQDPTVVRPAQTWRRLYLVELESGATTEVSPERLNVWEVDWRGGRAVAICSDDPSESGWYGAHVALLDLERRSAERVHVPRWQVQGPRLSPDGRRVAFAEGFSSDRGTLTGSLTVVDLETGSARDLAPELDVTWLAWRDDEALWYAGWRGLGSIAGSVGLDGSVDELVAGDFTLGTRHGPRLGAGASGVVAAVLEGPRRPAEVVVLEREGPRALTALNAAFDDVATPEIERFAWRAADGLEIEGVLVLPCERSGELPLVVMVHGGPTAAWAFEYAPGRTAPLLAEAGYAVLLPNPRGSVGRGQEFARANLGDMGGADLRDILAGIDALAEAGIVDGDRVGITGGSYGGFMAAWAITQTDRFAASIPVACVSNWLSFHNTTNIGQFDALYLDSDPYDSAGEYPRRSPVMFASRARTPTLIVHGEKDLCTPLGQAQELYQALVEAGCETELVIYPREGHGAVEYEHQLDHWQRTRAWFDRYLGA